MKTPIHPCLWFDGQAEAAAELYCNLLPNSRITVNTPMVVNFELLGKKFMGLNGGPMFKINPSISLFVYCETIKQTDALWNGLITGGKAMMAIDTYPWSKRYGWLQDKFGTTWQISVGETEGQPSRMAPCFLFTAPQFGRAEEAVKFYSSVFEASAIQSMIHYPQPDPNAGKVMYSEFKLDGYDLIAMDGPGTHDYTFSEGVSMVITCETQKEIDYYWTRLTESGQESRCGWLKDKFGVSWQVVPAALGKLMSDPVRGQRVMQALLKMNKLDLGVLENA